MNTDQQCYLLTIFINTTASFDSIRFPECGTITFDDLHRNGTVRFDSIINRNGTIRFYSIIGLVRFGTIRFETIGVRSSIVLRLLNSLTSPCHSLLSPSPPPPLPPHTPPAISALSRFLTFYAKLARVTRVTHYNLVITSL